jgi:hypothetical protein
MGFRFRCIALFLCIWFGVVLAAGKAADMKDFRHASAFRDALDEDDEVDRIAYDGLHRLLAGFGRQLFQALQSRICVYRGDAARMSGIPGFQERERSSVTHLADDDAIWPEAHCALEQARHIDGIAGVQAHGVHRGALNLGRVFENDEPIFGRMLDDFRKDRVRQRRLARAGSARHHDVEL